MGQGKDFAGTLLVKYVATIPAVVLPIRKAKGCSATHADIGICPLRRLEEVVD